MSRDFFLDVAALLGTGGLLGGGFRDQLFGFAHRQALGHDLVSQRDLRCCINCQQSTGVAHVDVACHQHGLHRFGQVQQAQQVGDGAAL